MCSKTDRGPSFFSTLLGGSAAADSDPLYLVTGAAKLADGRIAVANGGSHEIRMYSPTGTYMRSIGRNGSGPGEFRSIGGIMTLPPDSLLVYDKSMGRLSVFDEEGAFARSFYLDIEPIVIPIGVLANGILGLKVSHMVDLGRAGLNVDSALILRFDRSGLLIDSIGRHPHNWRFKQQYGEIQSTVGVPFAPQGQLTPEGEGYCYTDGARYAISCFDASANLRQVVRFAHDPVAVTSDMIENYFDRQWRTAPENRRQAIARMKADLPIPPSLPAISRMMTDLLGNLWVEDYPSPDDPSRPGQWRVLDSSGGLIALVETGPTLELLEIGADYLLARWRDSNDVEHVSLFPLSKALPEEQRGD